MNTFLLAAVALGLVAFLVIRRKRQAAAGAAPAAERAPRAPRLRGRGKTRRDGTIQGYPDAVAEGPTAAAVAEAAASRTLSPVLEPLPPAAPAPPPAEPAVPAGSPGDWGFDEMIVEPGWPMPGEIAGTWPSGAPTTEPPLAGPPIAVAEPVAVAEPAAPRDDAVADQVTGEWAMPTTTTTPTYAAPEADPVDDAPQPEAAYAEAEPDADPAMEAWVPGVSEVEPVVLPDSEPDAPAADPEPVLVWADAAPAAEDEPVAGPIDDVFPADEVAGPPPWQPEAVEEPDHVPVVEPDEVEEPEPVEALLPAWEPEPEVVAEPVVVTVDAPWEPVVEPAFAAVDDADPAEQVDAVAEGLPRAVAALTPVLAEGDALGVTPRMAAVLRALADEPRGLPDLGRALGVSRPVVADVCARLEDLELVWRERDPDDRRRLLVVPTLKGLKLADETVPGLDRAAVAEALDRLSPAERAALVSAVRVLREA
ncbi:MAG: MarR family transcriptional regulator [Thermoleophilia bacterium]